MTYHQGGKKYLDQKSTLPTFKAAISLRGLDCQRKKWNMYLVKLVRYKIKILVNANITYYSPIVTGARLQHRTTRNYALTPREQALVALHWLGNGGQYHGVADMHGPSKATVCRVLKRFVNAVFEGLLPKVIRFPDNPAQIATEFFEKGELTELRKFEYYLM